MPAAPPTWEETTAAEPTWDETSPIVAKADLSKLKLSPYDQTVTGRFGEHLKPESGMESGTELLTALVNTPAGRAVASGAESLGGQIKRQASGWAMSIWMRSAEDRWPGLKP